MESFELTLNRNVTPIREMGGRFKELIPGKPTMTLKVRQDENIIKESIFDDSYTMDRIIASMTMYHLLNEGLSKEVKKELEPYGITFPRVEKMDVELLDFKERVLSCKEALPLLLGIHPDIDKDIEERLK